MSSARPDYPRAPQSATTVGTPGHASAGRPGDRHLAPAVTAPWGPQPPAAPLTRWSQPRPRRGLSVLGIIASLLAALGLVATISLIASDTGTAAAAVGSLVALVPLGIVLLAVRWLDRWEPEPRAALLFAFLWGAGVATLVSLLANSSLTQLVYEVTLDVNQAELVGAAVVAPFVEESAKGLGIVVLFLARRRHFDGPVDGVVYAAMVAGGFAFVENILYFGDSLDVLPQIFVLRGIMSPFAHVFFSAFMGIALGAVARHRTQLLWLLTLPLGWLVAVALHALWNLSAFTGTFFGLYLFVQVPLFLGMIGVLLWLRHRERRVILHRLTEYGQAGWFAPFEVAMLASLPERRNARRWAGGLRPGGARVMKSFQRSATRLAYLRQRSAIGRVDAHHAADEQALLHEVTASRARLLDTAAG